MAISIPVPAAKPFPPFPVLSTRQEAFCRGFVATGPNYTGWPGRRGGPAMPNARRGRPAMP